MCVGCTPWVAIAIVVAVVGVAGVALYKLTKEASKDKCKLKGSEAEQQQLSTLKEDIRNAGPKGKAFIQSLESGPNQIDIYIATSATRKDGTVIPLSNTGGGITLRPTESQSGNIEVY